MKRSGWLTVLIVGFGLAAPSEGVCGGWLDFVVFRIGAELGSADAQYNLGLMYEKGDVIKGHNMQAVYWYEKAAEQGVLDAQVRLANLTALGRGVRQNRVHSYALYNLAALRGDKAAEESRDALERKMSPAEIETARRLTVEWIKKNSGGGE